MRAAFHMAHGTPRPRTRPTQVSFVFSRHPLETRMPPLSRDHITVSVQAKIHQLQKFLAIKLGVPDWSAFQAPREPPTTST